ncbi:MSMEG_0565 family glycosyltransferase [Acaryochloris marina]|uniref:MSMEG_0565 family glycosyltransferase n=1 Tax=Acaryochloris marina TaxID=155978 RepID=UPI001BAF9C52|nr:MSMEG_0565 family glycosyltransferase [Acaryochloris marina]QUY45346.1 MSMEG_0565 family glycosyltransferase [Acaryochloris marina S15]
MANPSLSIALLTYATKPRGSVIHTLELAAALTALGHQACVYALDKDGKGFERALPHPVQLIPAQAAPADIDALIQQRIQEFVEFLADHPHHHDIYHAQDCISANALIQLRQKQHLPHVVRTVHHIEDFQSPYLQQCQDRSIRDPDLCLCVSDHWQERLAAEYQITAPRVTNGVNLERFSSTTTGQEFALKQTLGLTGSPIYLTVGGIEPRKNSIRLLTAFAQVLQQTPQAQLVIVGGATLFDYQDYRDQFFQQVQALQIEIGRSLILPGVVSDIDLSVLYRCADAFCFPSLKEGWGLVVLEAIASGLPLLLSDQPPFTEFLGREQAVWVNPQDTNHIAEGMRTLDPSHDSPSAISIATQILDQYSWHQSALCHIEQYHRLLDHGIN